MDDQKRRVAAEAFKGGQEMTKNNFPPDSVFCKELDDLFPKEFLRQTATETGLIKRERKIDPVIMFWVLVLSFGVGMQRTLASLKRNYEHEAKTTLRDSSWYYRFTDELILFLKRCVIHGIEQQAKDKHRDLSEKLDRFEDVLIQDSTIIRVPEKLAKIWPATRARKVAAGVKVSTLVSAVANGPKSIALFSENTAEVKTLKLGPWVKDRVLLIDLGFYKHHTFARIDEMKGFFVSRLKDSADPKIVGVNSICRGNNIDVVGKKWSEVLPHLKRQVLDVEVEISFKRRKYNGKKRKDMTKFRLIAIYNNDDRKYHAYITNISGDKLDPEEIASLYGARWEIELIFKELKSRYALDVINTSNPKIIESLIWVGILTLLCSRAIYNLFRRIVVANGEEPVRFTQMRWSRVFSETAHRHLSNLMDYLKLDFDTLKMMNVMHSQALDPHVYRKRFREGLWA
jgi:putative transposase